MNHSAQLQQDVRCVEPVRKFFLIEHSGFPVLIAGENTADSCSGNLARRHANHHNPHVSGHKQEGALTAPFGKKVLYGLDRFRLAIDAFDWMWKASIR